MDTKEAIDWLEWAKRQKFVLYNGEISSEPFENIIELLRRGENIKKTITIEIEANNKNVIKWAKHEIKDLENNVWNHKLKINVIEKGNS